MDATSSSSTSTSSEENAHSSSASTFPLSQTSFGWADSQVFTEEEFYGHDTPDFLPEQSVPDNSLCYLHHSDQRDIIGSSNTMRWTSRLISDKEERVHFNIDRSRVAAWTTLKSEVHHFRHTVTPMLFPADSIDGRQQQADPMIILKKLIHLVFDRRSDFYNELNNEIKIDYVAYLKFMATISIQMAYREMPSCLYDPSSLLLDKLVMEEKDYLKIWSEIATTKKVKLSAFIGSNRRDNCIWQSLERATNKFLRKVAIVNRTDDISIALDDDKIWVQSSGTNEEDNFGLRKVTHVNDNRKGLVAHTAANAGIIFPVGFLMERVGERATDCFQRLFHNLFPPTSYSQGNQTLPNLNGVINHSDRGYTLESTTFDFLLPAGGDFNNTVKRIMPFPFVWGMKVPDSDPREVLDERGAPSLFVKETKKHGRLVSVSAFRTGTKNISAVISTLLHGHEWEGVCLCPNQRRMYESDKKNGLRGYIFQTLACSPLIQQFSGAVEDELDELVETTIDVYTVEQGTADWHIVRRFSMTSSQASFAFNMAFIIYQNDRDWCTVAQFLYGRNYHTREFLFSFFVLFLFFLILI